MKSTISVFQLDQFPTPGEACLTCSLALAACTVQRYLCKEAQHQPFRAAARTH